MIYYLVQGEAYQYPLRIAEMQNSGAKVIFLTWDKQIKDALFLPNSTWIEGRNFLIDHVLKNNYVFEYLVVMDGDAKPIKGSWKAFNEFLLLKKPQVCHPILPNSKSLIQRILKKLALPSFMPLYQRAIISDSQVQAFRKDIIYAIGKQLYHTNFDNICWWYSGTLTRHILHHIVPYNTIQFNRLEIENESHLEYPMNYDRSYIGNYINKIGLNYIFPLFKFTPIPRSILGRLIILVNSIIELFYWIPFPIKEFNAIKRAEYVKQCLQKI